MFDYNQCHYNSTSHRTTRSGYSITIVGKKTAGFVSLLLLMLLSMPLIQCSNKHQQTSTTADTSATLTSSTVIDDCCCEMGTVERSNERELAPLLDKLVKTRFFRYFKVDLFRECPLWVNDAVCMEHGCAICECNEDEVPSYWQSITTDRVSIKTPENFVGWRDQTEGMWALQGEESVMSYVNLATYEESNTGYRNGSVIWEQVYRQNCFKSGAVSDMCLEERILFRLLSGLHTSITTHIFAKFARDSASGEWMANYDLFNRTVMQHPERMKNLLFSYLFMLRAIHQASPHLSDFVYSTGNEKEDVATQELVQELLKVNLLCAPNFDDSVEDILTCSSSNVERKQEFKEAFRNISSIMDCVSCEKCKVFAKLQILGLGTALKILFEPDIDYPFERNEVIAMINTVRQLSWSVKFLTEYRRRVGLDAPELDSVNQSVPLHASSLPLPVDSVTSSRFPRWVSVALLGLVTLLFTWMRARTRSATKIHKTE